MILLGSAIEFSDEGVSVLTVNGLNLLLIRHNNKYYLIENKCGHFGVPLVNGEIKNETIKCSQHGIMFSLISGEILNRPYEKCDMIKVFKIVQQGDELYMDESIL